MPSDVPEDTLPEEDPLQLKSPPELESLGAAMPSDVPEDTLPEVTSFTEIAMLEPDSPKIAYGEKPDKEKGALVIPAKQKREKTQLLMLRRQFQKDQGLPQTLKMKVKIQRMLLNHSQQQQFPQKLLLLKNIVKAKFFQRELPNQRN